MAFYTIPLPTKPRFRKNEEPSIPSQRFLILANEIVHIFPLEKHATYFTPIKQVKKISILTSGKLWHHYNYTKDRMKVESVLKSYKKEAVTIVFSKKGADVMEISALLLVTSRNLEYAVLIKPVALVRSKLIKDDNVRGNTNTV
uniref:Uncharacterized protein n=1 Tax=Trichogramma kaykai TaxID=54128 RepID=A0ABD2VZR6_9HYME